MVDGKGLSQPFVVTADPRTDATQEDLEAQFNFLYDINKKLDETHDAIRNMRSIKSQVAELNNRLDSTKYKNLITAGNTLDSLMTDIEKALYQTKLKSNQDMLNFPIRLNNKLAHLSALSEMSASRPTAQMVEVKEEITQQIDLQLVKWNDIQNKQLLKYNVLIRQSDILIIGLKKRLAKNISNPDVLGIRQE